MHQGKYVFAQITEFLPRRVFDGTDKLIRFMDNFAAQTIKRTVVILDNSPIHRAKKFMAKIEEWRDQDVYIFFLPP